MRAKTYKFNESILARMFAFISLFIEQLKYVKTEKKDSSVENNKILASLMSKTN